MTEEGGVANYSPGLAKKSRKLVHIHKTHKSQLFSSHPGSFPSRMNSECWEGTFSDITLMDLCGVNNRPQEIPITDSCTVFTLVDECEPTFNLDMWDQPGDETAECSSWHAEACNLENAISDLSIFSFIFKRRPHISQEDKGNDSPPQPHPQKLDPRFDELEIWSRTAYLEIILHLRYYIVERTHRRCYSAIIIRCKSSSRQWLNPFKLISFLFLPKKSLSDLKIPWEVRIYISLLLFPPFLLPAAGSYL